MNRSSQNFHEESKKIIVQYAIFRWENAIILAGAIILTTFYKQPFPWWPSWGWIAVGLVGMGLIFFSSIRNTKNNAQLLLRSYQESFDLKKIRLPELRQDVETAFQYQRRIDEYVWEQNDSVLWDRAQDTANQIRTWIHNVYQLACKIDVYQRDNLIRQELAELPQEIETLERQRKQGLEAQVLDDFNQLLQSKQKHLNTLTSLAAKMKQAEFQLHHSISALATVDSQIRLIAAQDVDSNKSESLRADIQEQVNRLNDLIASIEEVYTT